MSAFPPGLNPVDDLSSSLWVQEALKGWPSARFRVRDLVPPVFEAYARILHRTENDDGARFRTGTWAQRAAELGRELGPETTWWTLMGTLPYEGERDPWTPQEGRLSTSEVTTLVSFLGADMADPRACWFGLWSGFGFLSHGGAAYLRAPETFRERWANRAIRRAERKRDREAERALSKLPTFSLLGQRRPYYLIQGMVTDAERFLFEPGAWFQSPTLWWPDDRSWFVHTEIDGMSTYVGGPRSLVDSLVGEKVLEAFEVAPDTPAAL